MQNRTVTTPNEVIENNRSRGRFGDLQYPSSGSTHGVYMEFSQYSYQGGAVAGVSRAGSISLPLPENITDSFGINVGGKELGISGAAVADMISGGPGNYMKDLLAQAENMGRESAQTAQSEGGISSVKSLAGTAATYANFITKSGLASIAPGFGDTLSAATGEAINPHATLVFDGVNLKSFSLQWKLAPSSEAESQQIHNIIRTIKSKILPKYSGIGGSGNSSFSRGILTYPNMVNIYFVGIDPNKIFQFKQSMVSSLSVDYSPNGNVMIKGANGSAPGFINLSMSFTESQIWTAEEFGG